MYHLFNFGSSASRKPSPKRLNANTAIAINTPGIVQIHQQFRMYSFPDESIAPIPVLEVLIPPPESLAKTLQE